MIRSMIRSMTRRGLLIALLIATGAMAATDVAPAPRDKFAHANQNVKELLLLLDTDKSGRIIETRMDELHGSGIQQTG